MEVSSLERCLHYGGVLFREVSILRGSIVFCLRTKFSLPKNTFEQLTPPSGSLWEICCASQIQVSMSWELETMYLSQTSTSADGLWLETFTGDVINYFACFFVPFPQAIRRKENGWYDEEHPLVFLFLGSSGIGMCACHWNVCHIMCHWYMCVIGVCVIGTCVSLVQVCPWYLCHW